VAKLLKETPRRITRLNLNLGKEHGGPLKYKVFYRYLDRVLSLTYDLRTASPDDTEELERRSSRRCCRACATTCWSSPRTTSAPTSAS
jgi:hypothetical protein